MKKLISKIIVISAIFIFATPSSTYAAKLNWDNPNSNGSGPFQLKLEDSLNSNLIMSVIGCTGIVNKVSGAITGFVQKEVNKGIDYAKEEAVSKTAETAVKALGLSVSNVPESGPGYATSVTDVNFSTQKTKDRQATDALNRVGTKLDAQQKREECLNGIAYTLAKNQLTSMTKSTMNWVTTGFNGDPMYVNNMDSFLNNITDTILETEVAKFQGKPSMYPYGDNYARSAFGGRLNNLNFGEVMKQDLDSYLLSGGLGNDLANGATDVAKLYTNNFGLGGWNGWLAFTQEPSNNPLGYEMSMSQHVADVQNSQIEQTKSELQTNGGILDQRKCVEYAPSTDSILSSLSGKTNDATNSKGKCIKWQTVTPGSIIKDKISTYVNSPERQLELADTINEVLNSLFSTLISKLQHDGLSSLSSDSNEFSGVSSGPGVNKLFDSNGLEISNSTNSSGFSGPFDITKDLGNIYTSKIYAGNWDASTNTTTNTKEPHLSRGVGVKNEYYIVTKGASNLRSADSVYLFEGNTSWEVGNQVFFNGTNWKKGVPPYIIAKRGIIQNQQDYINNAQKVLAKLPEVMPALGELDYCIPGPNPNWQVNSAGAYTAYTDWLYAIGTGYNKGGFLKKSSVQITLPDTTSLEYKAYKSIFDATFWRKNIINSKFFAASGESKNDKTNPFDRQNWGCKPGKLPRMFWKGDKCMSQAQDTITYYVQKINDDLEATSKKYVNQINKMYGNESPLNNPLAIENMNNDTKYLEMAQAGQNITKNIVSYDQKVREALTDYRDSVTEGCSNIYKLNVIKEKVNIIVKAAQQRRDVKIAKYNLENKDHKIVIDQSCKDAELGGYLSNDNDNNPKLLQKSCGNSKINLSDAENDEIEANTTNAVNQAIIDAKVREALDVRDKALLLCSDIVDDEAHAICEDTANTTYESTINSIVATTVVTDTSGTSIDTTSKPSIANMDFKINFLDGTISLTGEVNPNGSQTKIWVEFDEKTLSSRAPTVYNIQDIKNGTSYVKLSTTIKKFSATVYNYTIRAKNINGGVSYTKEINLAPTLTPVVPTPVVPTPTGGRRG